MKIQTPMGTATRQTLPHCVVLRCPHCPYEMAIDASKINRDLVKLQCGNAECGEWSLGRQWLQIWPVASVSAFPARPVVSDKEQADLDMDGV